MPVANAVSSWTPQVSARSSQTQPDVEFITASVLKQREEGLHQVAGRGYDRITAQEFMREDRFVRRELVGGTQQEPADLARRDAARRGEIRSGGGRGRAGSCWRGYGPEWE